MFRQAFSVKCFPSNVFRHVFSVKGFPSSIFRQAFSVKCFPSSVFRHAFSAKCFPSIVFLSYVRNFLDGGVFRSICNLFVCLACCVCLIIWLGLAWLCLAWLGLAWLGFWVLFWRFASSFFLLKSNAFHQQIRVLHIF